MKCYHLIAAPFPISTSQAVSTTVGLFHSPMYKQHRWARVDIICLEKICVKYYLHMETMFFDTVPHSILEQLPRTVRSKRSQTAGQQSKAASHALRIKTCMSAFVKVYKNYRTPFVVDVANPFLSHSSVSLKHNKRTKRDKTSRFCVHLLVQGIS